MPSSADRPDVTTSVRPLPHVVRTWRVEEVAVTGSTNADLVAQARAGAPAGQVLVAHRQTAGRGRLDRSWSTPPGAGVACSVLWRPAAGTGRWSWLPLLTGVGVLAGLERALAGAGADPGPLGLKWPNDVLAHGLKLCGILAEVAQTPLGPAVVMGFGINVNLSAAELPVPTATSLALVAGRSLEPDQVVRCVLEALHDEYAAWEASGGDPWLSGTASRYRERCATLGQEVRVQLPGAPDLTGTALDIDDDGRLVVRAAGASHHVAAGDVVHVRRA